MSKSQMPKRPKPSMRVLGRTMKMLFSYYPVLTLRLTTQGACPVVSFLF